MSILSEPLLTLREAAQRLPGRPHISTLHRWRTRGVNGFRLRTKKIGGRRMVSVADLEAFIQEVTAVADKAPALALHIHKARTKQIEDAEAELARLGLCGNEKK